MYLAALTKVWPTKYLGLPFGGSPREKEFWYPVLDRCRQRLARWKANYLSFWEQNNLSIYYLSLFKSQRVLLQILKDYKTNSFEGVKKHKNPS